MITSIGTARTNHHFDTIGGPKPVQTREDYARVQKQWIAMWRTRGVKIQPQTILRPVAARIDGGRWLVDCECGNAPLTDPEWREARCLSCGNTYPNVVFPNDWQELEVVLSKRPNPAHRHSTDLLVDGSRKAIALSDLQAENVALGLEEIADGVVDPL